MALHVREPGEAIAKHGGAFEVQLFGRLVHGARNRFLDVLTAPGEKVLGLPHQFAITLVAVSCVHGPEQRLI